MRLAVQKQALRRARKIAGQYASVRREHAEEANATDVALDLVSDVLVELVHPGARKHVRLVAQDLVDLLVLVMRRLPVDQREQADHREREQAAVQ
ncbi:MAG: hypothetical protein QM741_12745 [Rudaea sp.]|uniref:hypothetical protein n=1 Tax=Rudaea sp. TaxID=2136325 RepID=UPI0039E694D9